MARKKAAKKGSGRVTVKAPVRKPARRKPMHRDKDEKTLPKPGHDLPEPPKPGNALPGGPPVRPSQDLPGQGTQPSHPIAGPPPVKPGTKPVDPAAPKRVEGTVKGDRDYEGRRVREHTPAQVAKDLVEREAQERKDQEAKKAAEKAAKDKAEALARAEAADKAAKAEAEAVEKAKKDEDAKKDAQK